MLENKYLCNVNAFVFHHYIMNFLMYLHVRRGTEKFSTQLTFQNMINL